MASILACIPSDPDISGIGVRVAIYIQNLFCFIPAIWALWDGQVTEYELESAETQSTTNLIVAFAILISTIVQAKTLGLSNYHAAIVLDLSWMNNTNAFIYFLLYVQYKSQPGRDSIERKWSAWYRHIREQLRALVSVADGEYSQTCSLPADVLSVDDSPPNATGVKILFRRIALFLGSVHLTLMAALGIWLWSNPRTFGTANTCAVDSATVAILGCRVPFDSNALRVGSIMVYSVFLVPGLNLLAPMVLFLGLYLAYHAWTKTHPRDATPSSPSPPSFLRAHTPLGRYMVDVVQWYDRAISASGVQPIFVGLVILFVVNIIFLADIELTIQRNRHLQDSDSGETQWNFGQILAMLLLVLPLRDLAETIVARRERRHQQQHKEELTRSLRIVIEQRSSGHFIGLIERGADVNTIVEGHRYATVLAVAASQKDEVLVRSLIHLKANPCLNSKDGQTALNIATKQECWPIIRLVVAAGADTNEIFSDGQYGCALQAACYRGNTDIVKFLLERKADPNTQGTGFFCALQAACYVGNTDIVTLLLEHKADPNIQGGMYGCALQAACYVRNTNIVTLLLEHKADPNIQGGYYGCALQAACYRENTNTVKLLLEHKADPNIQASAKETILESAQQFGNAEIIQALIEYVEQRPCRLSPCVQKADQVLGTQALTARDDNKN
ncbi:ankyrin repeat-containing domain protein, partial [Cristinia sonorae]